MIEIELGFEIRVLEFGFYLESNGESLEGIIIIIIINWYNFLF